MTEKELFDPKYTSRISLNSYKERTFEEIRNDVLTDLNEIMPELADLPNTLVDNLINTGCVLLKQNEGMIRYLFNGISEQSTANPFFDLVAQDYNMYRHPNAKGECQIKIVGVPGYIIPEGSKFCNTDNSIVFYNPKSEIINSVGEVVFTAYSDNTLDELKTVEVGTINKELTDTININTVQNITKPIPPRELESLNQFRNRLQQRLRNIVQGSIEGLVSTLSEIKGVDPKQVNVIKSEQTIQSVKYNSIEAIVGGGDSADVAKVLLDYCGLSPQVLVSNPSGGDHTRSVTQNIQSLSNIVPIKFTRPKTSNMKVIIKGTFNELLATNEQLTLSTQDYIINEFNKLTIRDKINQTFIEQAFIRAFKALGYTDQNIRDIVVEVWVDGTKGNWDGQQFLIEKKPDVMLYMTEYEVIQQ